MEQELEIASNDPGHPLRVLEDLGSAEYGAFVQTAHLLAQAWGLRQNLATQRGSFLSWMRVPGDVLMPCICPTGKTRRGGEGTGGNSVARGGTVFGTSF